MFTDKTASGDLRIMDDTVDIMKDKNSRIICIPFLKTRAEENRICSNFALKLSNDTIFPLLMQFYMH